MLRNHVNDTDLSTKVEALRPFVQVTGLGRGARPAGLIDEKIIINEGKVRPSLSSATIMCLRPDSHVMQHRGIRHGRNLRPFDIIPWP